MAPIQFRTIAGPVRAACAAFVMVLILAPLCHSADLVFIRSAAGSPGEQEQMEVAAKFYGLNLAVIAVNDDASLKKINERTDIVGIAIAANALAADDSSRLLRVLNLKRTISVPVLILGVTDKVNSAALTAWSAGTVSGCKSLEPTGRPQYRFGRVDGLTGQLSDLELWGAAADAPHMVLQESRAVRQILNLQDGDRTLPVFVETQGPQASVFVACAVHPDGTSPYAEGIVNTFLRLAPGMMFAKYSAGESGWHAPRHYANLTIDDPWLRQPYGYVDYKDLLEEMDKHNFHTTIAFIPWNYQRSQPEVVSIFKNHPERFSIAIHGNNHDHKEFTDYRTKPLPLQADAMKQSLARMEQFQALTGIPYDKVMVFPHSIAPLGTLEALKLSHYWATVNGSNVPQGEPTPTSLSFVLRPTTFSFAGFPSVNRHSIAAPIPAAFLAVNAYLDNPMFFYGHSEDFENGAQAFNEVADEVNHLQPDTQWAGLGEIVKHQYLIRARKDTDYDVLALSNNFCVENNAQQDATFNVQKEETGTDAIDSVLADGRPYPYEVKDRQLILSIAIPKGATRCVAVQYGKDIDLSSLVTGHDSSVAYALRMGSDFRDIYLSKSPAGVAFIRFYNEHQLSPVALLGFGFTFVGLCLYGGYRLRTFVRTEHHS